jgi:hypothetical protein
LQVIPFERVGFFQVHNLLAFAAPGSARPFAKCTFSQDGIPLAARDHNVDTTDEQLPRDAVVEGMVWYGEMRIPVVAWTFTHAPISLSGSSLNFTLQL